VLTVRKVWFVAAIAVVLSTTACQQGGTAAGPSQSPAASEQSDQGAPASSATPTPTPVVEPVSFEISPAGGAAKVRLDAPVTVKATNGTLTKVTVTDEDSATVRGTLADGVWHNDAALKGGASYTVTAVATDDEGKEQTTTSRFETLTPTSRVTASVLPLNNWTVGVGMPVVVNFTKAVAVKNRAATLKALTVSTAPAQVQGGWRWISSQQVQWRPANFWPVGTSVTVKADMAGVEVRPGVWGKGVTTSKFRIGAAMVSTVDIKKHTMTVTQNGHLLKVLPITTGKPGFDTRGGVKVIMSRELARRMDAETTGISQDNPEYYNIDNVRYAMRLTNSGEFLHAAPWSVGSQGHANVSHGCTGMSTANAKWLYEHSKVGDVVRYINAKRSPEWGNGYTAWNVSFSKWLSGA
jgi:lipoprotein-anchoring transpeptidase ErfK/SrfK